MITPEDKEIITIIAQKEGYNKGNVKIGVNLKRPWWQDFFGNPYFPLFVGAIILIFAIIFVNIKQKKSIFDRAGDGRIYTWLGGKQSFPLNVCIGDYTGRELMTTLVDQVRRCSIPYFDEHFVSKIFAKKGEIQGAFAIDLKDGKIKWNPTDNAN